MSKVFNNITTKETLLSVPLPLQSRVYRPVSNAVLINNTLEAIDKTGFNVEKEIYYSGNKGQQMLGRIGISMGNTEVGMELAFHNSYDKTLSLKFILGDKIWICQNGQCYGSEGTFKSKHFGSIQSEAPKSIQLYLDNLESKFEEVLKRKQRYEQIEVTKKTCSELLGRMFVEEEIITSTQLNIIKNELINPSYNYQADGTLWQFANHCSFSMQQTHPKEYINKSLELFKFVETEFA